MAQIKDLRRQFPLLARSVSGHPLAYLDSAATAQKPQCVIDAISNFYTTINANVNRGVHPLAEETTVAYEHARATVADFIGADHAHEIVFVRNATEGINLVARTWGDATVTNDDVIMLTEMEHHANIVPWLQLKERTGCTIEWIGVNERGVIDLAAFEKILKKGNVKIVSITGLSNVLGARPSLETILPLAKKHGARTLIDAAQLVVHEQINVQKLGCDFLVFSGHKLYAPMGIGVLFLKDELARSLPPFLGGGDMIASVKKDGFTAAEPSRKFEAGTPSIADAVGLAEAIRWLSGLDRNAIEHHESSLLTRAADGLKKITGVRLLGPDDRIGCVSFTIDGVHPHDLTEVLGREGICLRAGHHCAEPLHASLGINASARLSVALYNNEEDIDRFLTAIPRAIKLLKK